MNKEMILNTSDEAAHYVTNLSGWVSRNGRFYGEDERMARWDGCTHVVCRDCGQPVERHWLFCSDCRNRKDKERFRAREKKPYDGKPLFSNTHDKFFFTLEDLYDFCDDEEIVPAELELVICEPVLARRIDPNEYYSSSLPDDGEVSDELREAFDKLNEVIQKEKPLSWVPGKYAVDTSTLQQTAPTEAIKKPCPACSGTGKLYHGPDDDCHTTCKECNGRGIIRAVDTNTLPAATVEAPSRICKKCATETSSAFCHKCGASVLYVGTSNRPRK